MLVETLPCCSICRHFEINMGYHGYSELTPGSPGYVDCSLSGRPGCAWPRQEDFEGELPVTGLISIAERCELFTLHSELRA